MSENSTIFPKNSLSKCNFVEDLDFNFFQKTIFSSLFSNITETYGDIFDSHENKKLLTGLNSLIKINYKSESNKLMKETYKIPLQISVNPPSVIQQESEKSFSTRTCII
jgi:hypothetical protein